MKLDRAQLIGTDLDSLLIRLRKDGFKDFLSTGPGTYKRTYSVITSKSQIKSGSPYNINVLVNGNTIVDILWIGNGTSTIQQTDIYLLKE